MSSPSQPGAGRFFDSKLLLMLLREAAPYRRRFLWTGFWVLVVSGMIWIRPALIRHAIDVEMAEGDVRGLMWTCLAVVGVLLVEAFLQYRIAYLANWVAQSVSLDLRSKLFARVIRFRVKYFDSTPVGTLVTRHIGDIDGIADVFSNGILNAVGDLLALVVVVCAMFWMDWEWTLWVLVPIPFLIWATRVFQRHIKKAFVDVRNEVARMNEFVQEHVTGMSVVQAFGRERREAQKFEAINAAHRDANIHSVWAFSVFFPVVELLSAISVALLLWFGLNDVVSERMTLGALLQFMLYVFMLYRPIRQLADRFNVLQMGIVNSDRVFKLLALDAFPAPDGGVKATERFQGDIRFEGVWFAYNDEDWVLRDVSFHIEPGECIALVGATGAGKSSIVHLLTRFYEIQKGAIYIDGRDIREWDLEVLRREIGVVMQDVFLFSGTLRDNVTLHHDGVSDAQLDAAIEALGAADWIQRLPDGWNQDVRERGAILSVGQRQLIAFMRAQIQHPSILVLDEATSSIDRESERLVQRATEEMTEGRTSLLVAHRLSTIRHASRIFVVQQGQIVQSGHHDVLVSQPGPYRTLYEKQFKYT
jgi:ATP-binding cassette subfamily B protein